MAVALALLVSFSLVFAAASAEWVMARSSEVQQVQMPGSDGGRGDSVAGFSTVAQVIDACAPSTGLAGICQQTGLVGGLMRAWGRCGRRGDRQGGGSRRARTRRRKPS